MMDAAFDRPLREYASGHAGRKVVRESGRGYPGVLAGPGALGDGKHYLLGLFARDGAARVGE